MELLHKKLALSGKMGSGKSTISNQFVMNLGYECISIGSSIKALTTFVIVKDYQQIQDFLSILTEEVAVQEHVLTTLKEISVALNVQEFQQDETGVFIKNDVYRKLLQKIATFMREQFGETVWLQYLLTKYQDTPAIIIDDLRLKTEKQYLEAHGFTILRLDIQKEEQVRRLTKIYGELKEESFHHVTEVDLDNESFFARKDVSVDTPEKIFAYFKTALNKKRAS